MLRKAILKDIDNLYRLYQHVSLNRKKLNNPTYLAQIQKRDFLLGGESKQEVKSLLENSLLFLVYEQDKKLLGFAIASLEKEYRDDAYKMWFDQRVKRLYYHNPRSASLFSIAVDVRISQKGIAGHLLKALENKLRNLGYKYLFAVVALNPITNCPSLIYHAKHGFQKTAMGRPRTLFGLPHYSSVLFYKTL